MSQEKELKNVPILIIGESGEGKSTLLGSLNPKETIIINTEQKPMPFKNEKDFMIANVGTHKKMLEVLAYIESDEAKDIKTVALDSFTSLAEIINKYTSHNYSGFAVWSNYNLLLDEIIKRLKVLKKQVIVIGIPEQKDMETFGEMKKYLRVRGKELKYGQIEKEFAIVLFTNPIYDEDTGEVSSVEMIYKPNKRNSAKAPVGMFTKRPANNAKEILEKIEAYYKKE